GACPMRRCGRAGQPTTPTSTPAALSATVPSCPYSTRSSTTCAQPAGIEDTHAHTHIRVCMHVCTHTHTHIQACMHVHTHTHTHTHSLYTAHFLCRYKR